MKLSILLVIGFLLVSSLVFIVGYYSAQHTEQALEERTGQDRIYLAQETISTINRFLYERHQNARSLAENNLYEQYLTNLEEKRDIDNREIKELQHGLSEQLTLSGPWKNILLINKERMVVLATDTDLINTTLSEDETFELAYEAALSRKTYVSDAILLGEEQTPTMIFAAPITNDDQIERPVIGVLILELAWPAIEEILENANTENIYLANSAGLLIAEGKFKHGTLFNTTLSPKLLDAIPPEDSYFIFNSHFHNQSTSLVSSVRQRGHAEYNNHGWILIIEDSTEQIFSHVQSLRNTFLLVSLVSSVVAVIIGLLISRSIIVPIKRLEQSIRNISDGNLNDTIKPVRTAELNSLSNSFNAMRLHLLEARKKLEEQNKKLETDVQDKTKELRQKVDDLNKTKTATLNIMEDLKEAMEKQKQLERVKTEFLSITSHELRTPVTPMKAQLQMVLGEYFGNLNEEQKKSLEIVLFNTNQLDSLISDILDISKLESGSMKFRGTKASMNEVLTGVLDIMKIKANERNIKLVLEAEQIPEFTIDQERIRQVIVNLVNNAIKFSDANMQITISAKNEQNQVRVKVIDQGIGIDKKDQERLFKPFSQVDSSMSRNFEGSGLGLAISKGIVKNHGGSIGVESEPGKGSTFYFTLPYESKIETGVSELELFSFSTAAVTNNFKKVLANNNYELVPEKTEELIKEGFVTEDGKMRYDISLAKLEELGFIKKKE